MSSCNLLWPSFRRSCWRPRAEATQARAVCTSPSPELRLGPAPECLVVRHRAPRRPAVRTDQSSSQRAEANQETRRLMTRRHPQGCRLKRPVTTCSRRAQQPSRRRNQSLDQHHSVPWSRWRSASGCLPSGSSRAPVQQQHRLRSQVEQIAIDCRRSVPRHKRAQQKQQQL